MIEQDQDHEHDVDTEAEARKLGWAPREKWRGKAEEFVDADEFLRRGREVLPIVRSQVDQTRAENERLKQELAATRTEFDRRVKTTERMTQRLLDQQRIQMSEEFEGKKRAAVAKGDTAEYDRVARQESTAYAKMADEAREIAKEAAPVPQAQQPPPEAQEWLKRNDWFLKDKPLAMEAEALHIAMLQEQPGLGLSDNLERVTETLKQRYPAKFGGQTQQAAVRHSAVEGGSSGMRGGAGSRERGWKDLPADAKGACTGLISSGRLKGDPKKLQENYAKTYWEEYGE
jgi:hypothetical protein